MEQDLVLALIWASSRRMAIRQRCYEMLQQQNYREIFNDLVDSTELKKIATDLQHAERQGISTVCIHQQLYPEQLRQISDPPLVLFCHGSIELLNRKKSIWAIVGSRRASPPAIKLTQKISNLIVSRGGMVVSGLAIGIDTAAHQGAIQQHQESTIAVLGSGLPQIYPSCNQGLAKQIVQTGGLLLSKFYPDSRAFPANFIDRNRIIAGLAEHVLVIEASNKSGSRVTARYAIEQGKELHVVPGDFFSPAYLGSNQLIKNGANVLTQISDLDEFLPPQAMELSESQVAFSNTAKAILSLLTEQGIMSLDDIIQAISPPDQSLSCIFMDLLALNDAGLIQTMPGERYMLR